MKTKLSKKRAISTVLTTVIILVSSVVLGSGVVLYGTSLFQGGTQTEAIFVTAVKVWVDPTDPFSGTGIGWGAAGIRNTGDKVVAVNEITVRGQSIPFGQWYADTVVSSTVVQQALNHTGWDNQGTNVRMIDNCAASSEYVAIDPDSGGAITECITADAGTGPVSLDPGQSAIIYFKLNNNTITSLDSGVSTTVSIFAGKAGGPQSVTVIGK
ncbi:MAG: hypothetical protein ACE5DT_00485 [Nitrosopumilus sp.]